jgi:hypothetical protein
MRSSSSCRATWITVLLRLEPACSPSALRRPLPYLASGPQRQHGRAVDPDNQAFTFQGDDTGFDAPGQLGYFQIGGFTYVYLNNDADSTAESAFAMDGTIDLAAADFVL